MSGAISHWRRIAQLLLLSVVTMHAQPELKDTSYVSFDGREFGYHSWHSESTSDLVVIGVHGISGVSTDYEMLGNKIAAGGEAKALYAYELRGQGRDPVLERRGDILNLQSWFRDLRTFTALIRAKHPGSRIVWMGESLGSLIVSNTYQPDPDPRSDCDAIVLSSPITAFRSDFPRWKIGLARSFATAFPEVRLSLETLSDKDEVQVTQGTVHSDQAMKNDWHVQRHSLRSLNFIGTMIDRMMNFVTQIDVPMLVMNGGNDVFSDPADVTKWLAQLRSKVTHRYFPDSYHLLFYDHESEKVMQTTLDWLQSLQ